jgi:hypothetical protein
LPSYRLHLTHDPAGGDRYIEGFSRIDELKPGDTFPYGGTIWQVIEITDADDPSTRLAHCTPSFSDEPGG